MLLGMRLGFVVWTALSALGIAQACGGSTASKGPDQSGDAGQANGGRSTSSGATSGSASGAAAAGDQVEGGAPPSGGGAGGEAAEAGGQAGAEGGHGPVLVPEVSGTDCDGGLLQVDVLRAERCLMLDECGLIDSVYGCMKITNPFSTEGGYWTERDDLAWAMRCTNEYAGSGCAGVAACLEQFALPSALGNCEQPGETYCANNVLTFCDAAGQRYEHDCGSHGLVCGSTSDEQVYTQDMGCFPAGCAVWGPYDGQYCEGNVLVAESSFTNAASEAEPAIRLDCTSFGYDRCEGEPGQLAHCVK